MRSKKGLEKELQSIKREIAALGGKNTEFAELLSGKVKAQETSTGLLTLVKYLMDENRKTTMLLRNISENLARLETDLNATYEEENPKPEQYVQQPSGEKLVRELPISGLDARIIQTIQVMGMACADDIKSKMNYRGRNAASARLNRLYKQGILERYQLGHKVFYKYDAGKAASTLIVSPPQ